MCSPFMGKISVKLACFSRDCSVKPPTLGPYWKSLTHIKRRGRRGERQESQTRLWQGSVPSVPFAVLGAGSVGVEGGRDVL